MSWPFQEQYVVDVPQWQLLFSAKYQLVGVDPVVEHFADSSN